jgi:hypothetical protein
MTLYVLDTDFNIPIFLLGGLTIYLAILGGQISAR